MSRKRSRKSVAQAGSSSVPAPASKGLVARAQYDAAGHGRRMLGWRAPSTGPNRAAVGLETIRNRSRDAARNEWAGAAGERIWGTNLIGTGIVARPKTKDAALKARFTEIWDDFCATADADGVLDFYGMQTLAVEAWRTSGEVFIRFRPRRVEDGLRVPLQIQLLEADMVPQIDYDAWPGLPAGNRIRCGIEIDRIGRRAAYWCYREHPGDSPTTAVSHSDLVRVPATEMRHLFKPGRPGALRGVPAYAPVLPKLRSVGNFDDAVLERQQLANLFAMFVTRPPENGAPSIDPTTGLPVETDSSGQPMIGLEPGISQELAPGEDVKFSDPPDAGANYPDFMRQQHLGVASGSGTPYELLTGDVRDVSDRTLRIVINEFRRTCEQYQWQLIIPLFCQPVRDYVARMAVLAGELTPEQGREFARCTWSPHAWAYIHPTQDVQAKKMEIDAGIKSRTAVVAERGDDIEQVDAERAEDLAREIALGIGFAPKDPNAVPAPSPSEAAAAARVQAEARLFDARAARETVESTAAELGARAEAERLAADTRRAIADAELATARAKVANAEESIALARADHIKAEADSARRVAELQEALAREESAERVRHLEEQAANAHAESAARIAAIAAAEQHATDMRALAKAAEENRVLVSRLEVEAAEVGLAELRAE